MTKLKCPKCGSGDVKRFSIIYKQGISDVNLTTAAGGVGFGTAGMMVGGMDGNSRGTSQSALSMETAPPRRKRYFMLANSWIISFFLWLVIFFIPWVFINNAGGIGGIIYVLYLFLVGFLLYKYKYLYNKNIWPGLYNNWQDSFMCMKCENSFMFRK